MISQFDTQFGFRIFLKSIPAIELRAGGGRSAAGGRCSGRGHDPVTRQPARGVAPRPECSYNPLCGNSVLPRAVEARLRSFPRRRRSPGGLYSEGMFIVNDGVKGRAMDRPGGLSVMHLALVLSTLISLLAACVSVPAVRSAPQGTLESIVILYHSDVGGKSRAVWLTQQPAWRVGPEGHPSRYRSERGCPGAAGRRGWAVRSAQQAGARPDPLRVRGHGRFWLRRHRSWTGRSQLRPRFSARDDREEPICLSPMRMCGTRRRASSCCRPGWSCRRVESGSASCRCSTPPSRSSP